MTYYQGQSGGSFPLRHLLAAGIILIGILGYFTHTSVNPTTGEKQHVTMTAEQETAMGLQAAPEMASQMGGEVAASDPQAQEVTKIGNAVWHGSRAAQSPYEYQYHLLKDTQTVNAFALPGGQVFITKGLLDRLKTEGELAGVLGHETGHVVERHVAQQIAKGNLGQAIVNATGVAASGDRNGMAEYAAAEMVNKLTQLHFSRSDESQADERGLDFMSEAGFDPRAMLDVMKVLDEITQKEGRPPQMLVTHPYPQERIKAIQAWLNQHYPNGVPSNLKDPPLPLTGRASGADSRDRW